MSTAQVIYLQHHRSRRSVPNARLCRDCKKREAKVDGWCGPCGNDVARRISENRARKHRADLAAREGVCAGCLDPFDARAPVQIDEQTGETFHPSCAPIDVDVELEPA